MYNDKDPEPESNYFNCAVFQFASSCPRQFLTNYIFRYFQKLNLTFYEDAIVMITNASTDDKLRDMVVSQNDLEDGQIVGVVEL